MILMNSVTPGKQNEEEEAEFACCRLVHAGAPTFEIHLTIVSLIMSFVFQKLYIVNAHISVTTLPFKVHHALHSEPAENSSLWSIFPSFCLPFTLLNMASELTESEAQRYDRQIRVWGAEAQSRIQNSRVLVCGLSNMNVEV